jgi:hypothetical protein
MENEISLEELSKKVDYLIKLVEDSFWEDDDCFLSEEDCLTIEESRKEYLLGNSVSIEELKTELGFNGD